MKRKIVLSLLTSVVLAGSLFASPTKSELDAHKKIVGYFPEWGVYSAHNNYEPSDTPFEKLTHVNYAFARIIDGEVAIFDDWAATGISFGEAWDSKDKGNLGQFRKLKKEHPDTSVLISVGGWTQSAGFHDAALTEVSRQKFAASCVTFVRKWGFDGIDIDWEFPTQVRQADKIDTASDTGTPYADAGEKQTFTLLLKSIREALTKAGKEDGKYYQLTAAVGASVTTINNVETNKYYKYLDFINIMTYDMHGAWEKSTNHQSPLFSNPNIDDPYKLTIANAVKLMKEAGVPGYKIVIGAPYYSRGWKGVKNNGNMAELPGLNATATGGAKGIWDGGRAAGINPYYYIKQQMENDSSFSKYRDPYSKVPYLYSESKGEMYTYEDEVSVGVKADYVKDNSLGGVIFWELSADYPSKGSALTTVLFNKLLDGVHPRYKNEDIQAGAITTVTDNTINTTTTSDTTDTIAVTDNTTNTTTTSGTTDTIAVTDNTTNTTTTSGTTDAITVTDNTTIDTTVDEVDTAIVIEANGLEAWSASKVYFGGERVNYDGKIYKASWWTKGNTPGTELWGPWKVDTSLVTNEEIVVEDTNNIYEIYDATHTYLAGDRVSYGGYEYEAQWWSRNRTPSVELYTAWKLIGISLVTDVVIPTDTTESNEETNSESNSTTETTHVDIVETNTTTSTELITSTETVSVATDSLYSVSAASLAEEERVLTSSQLMSDVKHSIETLDNVEVEKIVALNPQNPSNVKRVESVISEADWEYIFPKRSPEYTYENFLKAVGKFPAFCGDYEDGRDAQKICATSLSTMFAHFTQETGGHTSYSDVAEWRQGLVYVREMGWNETMKGGYNSECNDAIWQGQTWPCGTYDDGEYKSYFGRGAKQLSYNYNYGPFSEAMTGDVRTLLDHPELVADTWYNLASAVFFFVYPQPPKPSMLHVVDGTWQPNERDIANGLKKGFGVTTQIINGGVECGGSVEVQQSLNRIKYYNEFANYLGVNVGTDEVLGCKNMKQFDTDGAGALAIYWEQDWGYDASKPEGKSYTCKLVGYQTPFSAFKEGDYGKCIDKHFDLEITK